MNMNAERIFKIIMSELETDGLKMEEDLERVINSSMEINEKTIKIKELLSKIAINEVSIIKFKGMAENNND